MTSPKKHLMPMLLFSAATAVYGNDLPITHNPAADDARDSLREIRKIENHLREDAAWSLQQTPTKNTEADKPKDAPKPETCLKYQNIDIQGMTYIKSQEFEHKLTECVSENSLNRLSKDIVAAYIDKGYVHTAIDFIEKDNNTITLKVKEGRIREITGNSRKVNIDTLFPNHENHPLNIRYLEQGIEQANKLIGNNVSMDIYTHDDGTATVALENQTSKPWFGSVTLDNKGSKPNQAVARVQVGVDSPLGWSDSLYLGAYSNVRQGNSHYSRGANVFYSVPYGNWTMSAYGGLSRSQSITEFASGTRLAYRSKSVAVGVKGERVLSRGQKHINYGYAGVDYLNIVSEYGGSRLTLQSPKLATVQAGFSHSQMLEKGIWINDINVEVGTGALGVKDTAESPFTARYVKVALQSDLTQSRRAGNWLIRNKHRLAAQYSKDDLYSAKQFAVSDRSGVRGFKHLALDGNTGVSLNNTVFARRQSATGLYVEPYVGADAGVVKDQENRYTGYGVAAGMNIGYKHHWQISLESARGFLRSRKGVKARENQVTASFRMSF